MENNNLPKWLQDWDRNFAKAQANHTTAVAELAAINTSLHAIELELMDEELDAAGDNIALWGIQTQLADIQETERELSKRFEIWKIGIDQLSGALTIKEAAVGNTIEYR
jgi:hypothetical protein